MPELKPKDFVTDQEVRWCPGCGDYAILKTLRIALANANVKPENTVFVSGIGCAARLPYYINTYGFHTIHGRAPAIATGIKLSRPELDVWVATGDGDGLSIGGNHLLHALRRNININILLFNNETYGLTKGQYSPTSRYHTVTPTSLTGSIERPVLPCIFALGARATFIGRAIDVEHKNLLNLLCAAHQHQGTSFVEILQNCIIYNKDVFARETDKKTMATNQILVEHGKPLLFGKGSDKGLQLNNSKLELEIVSVQAKNQNILVHDETSPILAHLLLNLLPPMPTPLGIIHRRKDKVFDLDFMAKKRRMGKSGIRELLHQGVVFRAKPNKIK